MDFGSIKNVGIQPVNNIVKEREKNGEYKGFTDFCERIADEGVNKKCIESLIKAGAFSEFEQTRSTLLSSFETVIFSLAFHVETDTKTSLSEDVQLLYFPKPGIVTVYFLFVESHDNGYNSVLKAVE